MKIDFGRYEKKNCLNFGYKETILSEILNNEENLNAFSSFINTRSNITALNLTDCNINSKKIELLINPINNSKITNLNISCNEINAKKAKALAATLANLTNLITLNIACNEIGGEGAKALAAALPNLTTLIINDNEIDDEGAEALAVALTSLTNLTTLIMNHNSIGDEGAAAIVAALINVTNFTKLDMSYNNLGDAGLMEIAKLSNLTKLAIKGIKINFVNMDKLLDLTNCQIIIDDYLTTHECIGLIQKLKKGNPDGKITPEDIKYILFKLAMQQDSNESNNNIKHIINSPEKYPFAINSRDEEGHSLLHFYSHEPDMQQFLFQHGIIPEQKQQHGRLKKLAQDTQSVHTKEAVALTKFNTSKLVEAYGNIDTQQLLTKAEAYHARLNELYKNDPDSIKLKLLSLPEGGKRDTMKETLAANKPAPNDQDYVATVIEKANRVLTTKYLAKTNGQYNSGYPTHEMEYGDGHKITIPQSLGLVKALIETMEIPIADKKQLLVTLISQNPELVESKLKIIQKWLGEEVTVEELTNRTECHKLLENTDLKIIEELFKNISGLDIDQTWREQKEFILAERIYTAATTYNGNKTACLHGVWDYIVNSASEINKEFYKATRDYHKTTKDFS